MVFRSFVLALALSAVVGGLAAQPLVLSQSTDSNTIIPGLTPACVSTVDWSARDNHYCRVYDIQVAFTAVAIRAGVEVDGGPTTVDIRFWTFSGAPAFGTQLGTTTTFTTPGDGSWDEKIVEIPLDYPVDLPIGDVLVEFRVRDNQLTNGMFFFGSNNLGQTGTPYLHAPSCGTTGPVSMQSLGFGDAHIILDIVVEYQPAPDPVISVRFPSGAGNHIQPSGSVNAGAFTPGAQSQIELQVFNRGAAAALSPVAASTSAAIGCTLGAASVSSSITPGTGATLTIPVTPNAGIGLFSFNVTVTSNDAFTPSYSFTVEGSRGMSGTYTINNTGGTPDYADIGDAFTDLELYGQAGPVVLEISGGPYTPTMAYGLGSQASLAKTPIRGNSLTNTITVRGAPGLKPVIDGGGIGAFIDPLTGTESGCMSFRGIYGLTLENLRFTGATGFGVMIVGTKFNGDLAGTANIKRCIFDNIAQGPGLLVAHEFVSYANVLVENCMVWGCGVGGSAYGNSFRGSIAFFNPGPNTVVQHNSVRHDAALGGINGCVGISGHPLSGTAITLNYNILSAVTAGKACIVFPASPGSGVTLSPAFADRNVYHRVGDTRLGIGYGYTLGGTAIPQEDYSDLDAWRTAFLTIDLNSIEGDPRFVSTTPGAIDLHLQASSPAINLAVGSTVTIDIDGDTRPTNSAPDAGADEYDGQVTFQIVSPTSMPNGTTGVVYSTEINATGGSAPFTWSISTGNLPPGLSLGTLSTTNSTAVTGTPSGTGTFSFTVRLQDSTNQSVTRNYSITVVSGAGRSGGTSGGGGGCAVSSRGLPLLAASMALVAFALTRRRRILGALQTGR